MRITLPNGALNSRELPDLGAGPRTYLEGRLVCLNCCKGFTVEILIVGGQTGWAPEQIPFVDCPDCGSTIMNIGSPNARICLRRGPTAEELWEEDRQAKKKKKK